MNTATLTIVRTAAPCPKEKAKQEIRNICNLIAEGAIEMLDNPDFKIKDLRQLFIKSKQEMGDVENELVQQNYSAAMREHLDKLCKEVLMHRDITAKGLWVQA